MEGKSKPIFDYLLHVCLVQRVPATVTLKIVIDACGVGAPLSLPWMYGLHETNGTPEGLKLRILRACRVAKYCTGRILMVGACAENQNAREVFVNGKHYGALTYCFTQAVMEVPEYGISIQDVLFKVSKQLEGKQDVIISCSQVRQDPLFTI